MGLVSVISARCVVGAVMSVSKLYGLAIPFALFGMVLVMYAPITGVYAAVFLAPFMPTMILAGDIPVDGALVIKSTDENSDGSLTAWSMYIACWEYCLYRHLRHSQEWEVLKYGRCILYS